MAPGPEVPPLARFYEWECAKFLRDQRRDIEWYARLARETGGPILELACGAGRVAVALAEAGWDVVGLDLQPYLLERARARAEERGLAARTEFLRGDMRAFALGRRFPLVILPYNTLGYLLTDAEVLDCLRCVAGHLAPGGLFAFQISPFEVGEPARPRGFLAAGPCEDGELTMYEAVTVEPARPVTHYDEEYHLRRPGHPVHIFRERLTLRSIYLGEMSRLLAAAGFAVRAVHGDVDGRPYPIPRHPSGPMLFETVLAGQEAGAPRQEAAPRAPSERAR